MPVSKTICVLPTNEVAHVSEEPRCLCIIQDLTTEQKRKYTHTLPISTSTKQLQEEVSHKLSYLENTFKMTFTRTVPSEKCTDNGVTYLEPNMNRTLADYGFEGGRVKNYVQVDCVHGTRPTSSRVMPITEDPDDGSSSTDWSFSKIPPPPPPPKVGTGTVRRNALSDVGAIDVKADFSESIKTGASRMKGKDFQGTEEKDSRLIGLVNQAMTCYLNSLIQTLFMTPEFRNALYKWEFDGADDEACTTIPFQLQRLFLALQTSDKQAVETTDLTKSFGWDSSEAWQQHDIQELCRVMFDALEQKFEKTAQAEIIKLYEGKMKDYVQCAECKYESARTDTYLDIPITIRPFGSNIAYKSVMEGLQAFVEPETLDGTNQYYCEKCAKKCDAKKGLKFITFPYLLTLQLKRFDFDYSTMHRVKLNDRMHFPEELDLNGFVEHETSKDSVSDTDTSSDIMDDPPEVGTDTDEPLRIDEEGDRSSRDSGNDDDRPYSGREGKVDVHRSDDSEEGSSVDEGIDIESQKSYNLAAAGGQSEDDGLLSGAIGGAPKKEFESLHGLPKSEISKGPYIYELFSVMIHSGSAVGGHYYAYIKSFADGQWYSFNDQIVSPISFEDVKKSYGGSAGRSSYQSSFSSSTNAYMLMYRQRDIVRNKGFMKVDELPDHIKVLAEEEQKSEIRMKELKEKKRNMCSIKVYCQHRALLEEENLAIAEENYEFHNSTTLEDATAEVHRLLKLDAAGVPIANCRLVKYDHYHQSLEQSLDEKTENQKETLAKLLGGSRLSYMFDLLMETRATEDEKFQVYEPGGITIKAYAADYRKGCFLDHVMIRMMPMDTVYSLKLVLSKHLRCNAKRIRIGYEKYPSDIDLLTSATQTLKEVGIFRSVKMYVDVMNNEEYKKLSGHDGKLHSDGDCVEGTRLWTLIDRSANLINVSVILPEDLPPYVLPPSRPATPPHTVTPLIQDQPIDEVVNHVADRAGAQDVPATSSSPSSDEGVGSYDDSSGNNTESKIVEGSVTSDMTKEGKGMFGASEETDEVTLFWRSPERELPDGSGGYGALQGERDFLPEERPEISAPDDVTSFSSVHLRRNSEEGEGSSGGSPNHIPLSAGDFQAELDRKFLAAGYSPTSPTSSLRCEDGSSSDSSSQTSGEFQFQDVGQHSADAAADSAGSCSTIDSTGTLCNPAEESLDATPGHAVETPSCLFPHGQDTETPYAELMAGTGARRVALPGMAKRVCEYPIFRDQDMDLLDHYDGRVEKSVDQSYAGSSAENPGLCQCGETTKTDAFGETRQSSSVDPSLSTQDTGPGYQCSKCGKLKPECVNFCNVDQIVMGDEASSFSSPLDPESGEGMDHITPLFADTDLEEIGAGDSAPGSKKPILEMTSTFHTSGTDQRQRTESSSSAVSDLGYGDQTKHPVCYFRVCSVSVNEEKCQVLRAQLDKRSTVGGLKREIRRIVRLPTRDFSIYRIFHGGQETELNSLNENFALISDDTKLKVKQERALRKDEYRCKVFHLNLTEDDPVKHLVDWVVRRGLSIKEAHLVVSKELLKQCEMDVKPENIRLRRKCWKNPGRIFLESDLFGSDIPINCNPEVFLEVLEKPEQKSNHDQLAVYCRRWRPSTLTLDPFQEVILQPSGHSRYHTITELKNRLADISGLSPTCIQWAKPRGVFPYHTSVLEIHDCLDWDPVYAEHMHSSPANITDDGSVIFFRDKDESLKKLENKERSELQAKEAARLSVLKSGSSCSSTRSGPSLRPYSRKEKALKIYTVGNTSKKKEPTTTL